MLTTQMLMRNLRSQDDEDGGTDIVLDLGGQPSIIDDAFIAALCGRFKELIANNERLLAVNIIVLSNNNISELPSETLYNLTSSIMLTAIFIEGNPLSYSSIRQLQEIKDQDRIKIIFTPYSFNMDMHKFKEFMKEQMCSMYEALMHITNVSSEDAPHCYDETIKIAKKVSKDEYSQNLIVQYEKHMVDNPEEKAELLAVICGANQVPRLRMVTQ